MAHAITPTSHSSAVVARKRPFDFDFSMPTVTSNPPRTAPTLRDFHAKPITMASENKPRLCDVTTAELRVIMKMSTDLLNVVMDS